MAKRNKIVFVYHHQFPEMWQDGLYMALQVLARDFDITYCNLAGAGFFNFLEFDFALGWGDFGSPADKVLKDCPIPKGLCIGGCANHPEKGYDIYFYETAFYKMFYSEFNEFPKIHAFGINTSIYKKTGKREKIWDYITVGAFASWKRQQLLGFKEGMRLAIGQIQWDNMNESRPIITNLLQQGVMISDMVEPEKLADIYRASRCVYIPAEIQGGGERAVLEARACGCKVEIEKDNPKLDELLFSPLWDYKYYAGKLRQGILQCLKK